MKAARLIRIGLVAAVISAVALVASSGAGFASSGAGADSSNQLYRWDIIHLSGPPPVTTTLPGGRRRHAQHPRATT